MTKQPSAATGGSLTRALCWALACAGWAWGCTGDAFLGSQPSVADFGPVVSTDNDAGAARLDAAPNAQAPADAGPVLSPAAALQLQLQAAGAVVGELELHCPERCARLELAAIGGKPPYTYSWEDGASEPARTICPTADTPLVAMVHDALGNTDSLELPVHLEACKAEPLCAMNPSFEGSPTLGPEWLGDASLSAQSWSDCRGTSPVARDLPRVVDAASGDEFPTATDGSSYLYLPANQRAHASVAQTLCAPLERGSIYYFKIDLAYAAEDRTGVPLQPGQLEIYSATNACTPAELLWASPALRTGFRSYCVALQPSTPATALLLRPTGAPGSDSAVFIDHIVPLTSCP